MDDRKKTVESERERERESIGKKMLELMKIREKRKAKEKESKEAGKYRWKSIWTSIGCVFSAILCNWLYKDASATQPKEGQWLAKLMKFCYWTAIVIGVLCLIGGIYFFFSYPQLRDEVDTLKTKEKFLEQEVEKQ